MNNIYAHTEPGSNYPQYVSINSRGHGGLSVTVRGPRQVFGEDGEINAAGNTASMELSREQAREMQLALQRYLIQTK